jgi:hypothetical protein
MCIIDRDDAHCAIIRPDLDLPHNLPFRGGSVELRRRKACKDASEIDLGNFKIEQVRSDIDVTTANTNSGNVRNRRK